MASSSEPLLRASGESPDIFWDAPLSASNTLNSTDTDLHADESDTSNDTECTSPFDENALGV